MRSVKLYSTLFAIICIAAFASGAYAQGGMASQTPSSTKGAVIKGKAPVNKTLLRGKLPNAREATLKNRLPVVVLKSNHRLLIFLMVMFVMSSSLSDQADMPGLSSLTAN